MAGQKISRNVELIRILHAIFLSSGGLQNFCKELGITLDTNTFLRTVKVAVLGGWEASNEFIDWFSGHLVSERSGSFTTFLIVDFESGGSEGEKTDTNALADSFLEAAGAATGTLTSSVVWYLSTSFNCMIELYILSFIFQDSRDPSWSGSLHSLGFQNY